MKKLILLLLLIANPVYGQSMQEKAKMAFAQVQIISKAKAAFDVVKVECLCQNCDCVECKCTKEQCVCKECNDFEAMYARCVKEQKVIVLAVSAPKITHQAWKVVELPSLSGEKPGYIVGIPKDGQLIRMDFPPNTPQQRIQLDILHMYYPLTTGYQECPSCPQGRVWIGTTTRR